MGEVVPAIRIAEPTEWFVVFHRKSTHRILSFLALGPYKHVSAFAYAPGFKAWVIYDVQWRGTSIRIVDQAALLELTRGLDILKVSRTGAHMGGSSRLGLYCVTAVKHLLGLRCVAATPTQLYRHILRSGGIDIGRPAPATADAD